MDWLVFGDDWGTHPSTTQYLVRHLPAGDRVAWVNSIGMRSPRLSVADARRILEKIGLTGRKTTPSPPNATAGDRVPADVSNGMPTMCVVHPKILPFHHAGPARAINRSLLARSIGSALGKISATRPIALSATPVAHFYLDALDIGRLIYLRLDDYSRLPGVDADLIAACEPQMMERADLIVCTARSLIPDAWRSKSLYIPQGVDWDHFAQARLEPPQGRVLGFFGLIAEWIDHELVAALARRRPDWRLRFVGAQRFVHPLLHELANVELLPAVPLAQLPSAIGDWSAAWIPFEISDLTRAVNPLKLREYLAAGLPTASTPLPEVEDMARVTEVCITADVETISRWLDDVAANDSVARRRQRRDSMRSEGWLNRSTELRQRVAELI